MIRYQNILLAEDNEDDQELFRMMMLDINPVVNFTLAANGREALEMLLQMNPAPDVIFLDLNMPLMNGFEFLTAIKTDKAYETWKHIPVVTLTTSIIHPERCYELGACVSITKPNSIRLYRTILADLLSHDIAAECEQLREAFIVPR